jgi:hypothetical protein
MSPKGLCAWDVRRLIALTRGLPVVSLPLSEIRELDEPYWCGALDGQMTCRAVVEHARLIQDSDLNFPVILSSDGRVMDGMHSICKALLEGLNAIKAVRFVADPTPDHVGIRPEDLPYDD